MGRLATVTGVHEDPVEVGYEESTKVGRSREPVIAKQDFQSGLPGQKQRQ